MKRDILGAILEQLPLRTALMAALALLGVTLLAAWLYGFQPEIAEYRKLAELRASEQLLDTSHEVQNGGAAIAALEAEVKQLRESLWGDSADVPQRQLQSWVIQRLDAIAMLRGVTLESVIPGESDTVLMFDELPYDVNVSGSYRELYRWLYEVEDGLRPMVVKRFDMTQAGGGNEVSMKLRLVSYRSDRGSS